MQVFIRYENSSVPIEVSHKDSIAGIKAAYQASGKCPTNHRDYIVLLFKGKVLDDEKIVGECGITNGSVIVHTEAPGEPFKGVNYRALSQSIKSRRHHQEESLRMLQQEDVWAADERGTIRNLGPEKSIVMNRSPKIGVNSSTSGTRDFFNQLSVRVDGSCYHILPRMEGRWNGEMVSIPVSEHGTQVCSGELLFRNDDGVWSQRQMITTIEGLSHTVNQWVKPIADGILKVESDDPSLRSCDILMKEIGMNIILITATSKRSGKPISVETVTLMDHGRRVRTIQLFDESGAFRHVYCMHEKRVVDAVSGAMEKYEPRFN